MLYVVALTVPSVKLAFDMVLKLGFEVQLTVMVIAASPEIVKVAGALSDIENLLKNR